MADEEIVRALRDYAQACISDKHYNFNPGLALMIANRIEQLIALSENGKSAIDTNQRLVAYIKELQLKLENANKDINLAISTDDYCLLCKHYIKCNGEECDCYEEGVGCTDENGNYFDLKWTCKDFNWGECPKMENTPCNGCDFVNNFEWRGKDDNQNK